MERKISSKPVDVSRLSPMMRQYWKVKEQYFGAAAGFLGWEIFMSCFLTMR